MNTLINSSSNNPVYQAFAQKGPSLGLIVPAFCMNLIALCGVTMNLFVIHTTIRTNSLRSTANFLMALISAFEVVHQSGHSIFLAIAVTGTNFVSRQTATFLALPMILCINANMMTTLCIAFDRLFAVSFTRIHDQFTQSRKHFYLAIHVAACALYSTFCTRFIVNYALENSNDPTTGCVCDLITFDNSAMGTKQFLLMVLPNGGAVLCYLVIGLLIRCNRTVAKETHTRLLRSLIIILGVSIGAYLFSLSFYQLVNHNVTFGLDSVQLWEWSFLAGGFLNIGAASHCPILYVNSVDYRMAFREQLSHMFSFVKWNSASVQHINSMSVPRKSTEQARRLSAIINTTNRIE